MTGIMILWAILCFIFGAVLSMCNINLKTWKYWVLLLILASGFLIGVYIGTNGW